jgi:Uncharacterized protein conserved in bacteria
MIRVCFTGHRPNKFNGWGQPMPENIKNWLNKYLDKIISFGKEVEFISGAAQGLDQWAAKLVLEKRELNDNVKLTMAVPYKDFGSNWPKQAQNELEEINKQADKIVYVHKGIYTSPYLLQLRNEWMVNNSDLVIAVWDGSTGGTFNCVQYAKLKKKKILWYNFVEDKTIKIN